MTKIAFFRAKIYFRYSRWLAHSLGAAGERLRGSPSDGRNSQTG
jgi:hypothetical protein